MYFSNLDSPFPLRFTPPQCTNQSRSRRSSRRENTLYAPIPLRTAPPQRCTPTPHIANLRLLARRTRAIWRLDAAFPLERIELFHETDIVLHSLCHCVPVCGIQGRCSRPIDVVSVACGVLVLVRWTSGGDVEVREGRDVGIPGVGIVDLEGAGVNFVHSEAAVEVCQGRDAGADPAWGESVFAGALGSVVCVVDHDFVFVGVAKEDIGNYVGRVAVNDLVE